MNNDWAKEWIANLGTAKLLAMYAEDVKFEDVIFGHKANSKKELIAFFVAMGGPDAGQHSFSFDGYSGNADSGAIEWTWHLKHGRDFLGVPAAGKETTTRGVTLMTFKDDKIASQRDYWDAASALRQLQVLK
jgi:steroid delta-isomerase-like uncharacterized protein